MNAADLIAVVEHLTATLRTTGERLDVDGKGVHIPTLLQIEAAKEGEQLRVKLVPAIRVDKAASFWIFDFAASIEGLIVTDKDIVAMTNRGKFRIAWLEHAEIP